MFVEGLKKHFQLGKDLESMFPRLMDLTDIHLSFLRCLRQRQRMAPVVDTLSDILLEQFSGSGAQKLKSAYGEFCSRHRDAVDIYKSYLHDRRFSEFVRHCQANPLLKKKGIPECILFVTQRLTKYPLLIEPLIKTSKDNKVEQEKFGKALALVKVRNQHIFSCFSIQKHVAEQHTEFHSMLYCHVYIYRVFHDFRTVY